MWWGITACPARLDLVFVLDESGSITWQDPDNWTRMKTFVSNVATAFPIRSDLTRVGIVKFSLNSTLVFYLDEHMTRSELEDVSF